MDDTDRDSYDGTSGDEDGHQEIESHGIAKEKVVQRFRSFKNEVLTPQQELDAHSWEAVADRWLKVSACLLAHLSLGFLLGILATCAIYLGPPVVRVRNLPSSDRFLLLVMRSVTALPMSAQQGFLDFSGQMYRFVLEYFPRKVADAVFMRPPDAKGRASIIRLNHPDVSGHWLFAQEDGAGPFVPCTKDIVILYGHGGGFFYRNELQLAPGLMNVVDRALDLHGLRVAILAVNYRTTPKHRFPAQLDDMSNAFKFLLDKMNVSAQRIAFMGDSAGGNLATAHALQIITENAKSGSSFPLPAGIISISPWLSISSEKEWPSYESNTRDFCNVVGLKQMASWYASESASQTDPLVSPVHATDVQLCKLPSYMMVSGEDDTLFSEQVHFMERLDAALEGDQAQGMSIHKHFSLVAEDCPHVHALLHGCFGERGQLTRDAMAGFLKSVAPPIE